MCSIDGEYAEVVDTTPHFARKKHRCDGHLGFIGKGQPYMRVATLFDGSWDTSRLCFWCWWVYESFGSAHRYHPHPHVLMEEVQECVAAEPDSEWQMELEWLEGACLADAKGGSHG